ncbi:hypothetical protein BP5796_10928 [Coleophoma crateriformis]|uniref:Golgi apparatus membrane protein TVP38 n=1 Tax=Coleophoma crateriformis TaxID=565419 RepID=A0A3D8QLC3_9HELO|nr:hypothetical protein BP5796_10928 [Coleophoma crateriformis]
MPKQKEEDEIALTAIETNKPVSEEEEYEYKPVQWKNFVTQPKYIPWWILTVVIVILTILISVHHDDIVTALQPLSVKIRDTPGGFVIPVLILIAISFPPLFGHEIIALLCGVVYGLWIGFAIVAAGTFIGEVGTWFAFKYALRKRAEKLERTNLNYGSLARLTRDGGFWVVLIIRFSIIPSHFSTAVFSTCNVNFWFFAIATFLTLPKQIILVYLGVILTQKQSDNKIQDIVFAGTFLVTIAAGVYIYLKMNKIKKTLIEEQEARKQAKRDLVNSAAESMDDERPMQGNAPHPNWI